jgi:hypothetical protein
MDANNEAMIIRPENLLPFNLDNIALLSPLNLQVNKVLKPYLRLQELTSIDVPSIKKMREHVLGCR